MDGEIGHDRVSGVGSALRACRMKHGIPLADIARALRIRQSFLSAIEDGRFSDLPGPTYAHGFVRAYSEFLGLDGDEVVRRFRAEEEEPAPSHELHFPVPRDESGGPRAGILLVGALIAVLAYGGWYVFTANENLVSDLTDPIPERLGSLLSGGKTENGSADTTGASREPPLAQDARRGDAATNDTATAGSNDAPVDGDSAAKSLDETDSMRSAGEAVAPAYAAVGEASEAKSTRGAAGRASRQPNETTLAEVSPPGQPLAHESAPRPSSDVAGPAAAISSDAPRSGTAESETGTTAMTPADSSSESPSESPSNSGGDPASTAATNAPLDLVILATEPSWIEIRDRRGRRVTGRLLQPGERYYVPKQTGLSMTVGNAGGVQLVVNGDTLPPLGESGVVRRGVNLDAESLRTQ